MFIKKKKGRRILFTGGHVFIYLVLVPAFGFDFVCTCCFCLCFVSYLFPFLGVRVSIFGVLFVFALFVFPFFVSDLMSAPVVFVFGFGSLFMCFVFWWLLMHDICFCLMCPFLLCVRCPVYSWLRNCVGVSFCCLVCFCPLLGGGVFLGGGMFFLSTWFRFPLLVSSSCLFS